MEVDSPSLALDNPNILEELPVEAISHIFSYLPAPHICELSSSSKSLGEVAESDVVWRRVVERDFGVHSRPQRKSAQDRIIAISSDPALNSKHGSLPKHHFSVLCGLFSFLTG